MPQNLVDKQLLERSDQTEVPNSEYRLACATQDEIMEKLNKLDFTQISYKLMNPDYGDAWSLEQTNKAIALYKMFLCLSYLYPHEIAPSQEIERVWHEHILNTFAYAQACQQIFGKFIHHSPYFGLGGEEERQNLNAAFAQTQLLFIKHFGIDIVK
ncbi:hypothetical protein ACE1CB_01930 [Aerosakkonema sp. BLCC-F2]